MFPSMSVKTEITFQDRAEVLICGSTLFACQLALESAQAGWTTALAMERLHPFHEAVNCLNPWVPCDRTESCFELIQTTLRDRGGTFRRNGRLYFNASNAAIEIEDRLCDAGVHIYYSTPVAGALTHQDQLYGVAFGGKPGLYAVESSLIVDATLEATVARTLGVPFRRTEHGDGMECVHYSIERQRATHYDEEGFFHQSSNGMEMQVENVHRYTHICMRYPERKAHPLRYAEEFRDIYAAALEISPNLPSQRFRGADAYLRRGTDRVDAVDGTVQGFDNLRIYSSWGIPDNRQGQLALLGGTFLFEAFPRHLRQQAIDSIERTEHSGARPCYRFRNDAITPATDPSAGTRHSFTDPDTAYPGMEKDAVSFTPPQPAPPKTLTIAGAGTSGMAALAQAADLNMETLCLDAGAELGGTVTVGGVTNLWYGRKTRGFSEYYRSMGAANDALNAEPFFSRIADVPAVSLLLLTPMCGVAVNQRAFRAVYVVTPWGLAAVGVQHVIDASGDASLAAWSGCACHFGNERDELTLWASLGSFKAGQPEARRQFLTPCDERNPEDTRRVIQAMRRYTRRGDAPAFLLAPRESRHIRTKKRITFLDVLAGRRFSDSILRFRSNLDIKGIAHSDAANAGLLSDTRFRNFEVSLPYAALVPDRIDNLLVVGKAYGCTSDALSMARMQRDLAMMGRAATCAMSLCVSRSLPTHALPVGDLQDDLIRLGIMETEDRSEDDFGIDQTAQDLMAELNGAASLEDSLACTARLLLLQKAHDIQALENADLSNPSVVRYLTLNKDAGGMAQCERMVRSWVDGAGPVIPEQDRMPETMSHLLPDQGFAPRPLYWVSALAQAESKKALVACRKIAALICDSEELGFNTFWVYTFCLAYCAERLASSACSPLLEQVLDSAKLQTPLLRRGADLRDSLDTESERTSYLRLCLLRALARCGHPRGYEGLIEYLDSAHAAFARNARSELCELSGEDFRFNGSGWRTWLTEHRENLKAKAYTHSLE